MDRIRELGAALAPRAGETPTAWRSRQLGEPDTQPTAHRSSAASPARRWNLALTSGALAAFLTIVAVGTTIHVGRSDGGTAPLPDTAEAASILRNAALVAQEADLAAPQAGQFVFTETVASPINQVQQPDGSFATSHGPRVLRQTWLSADGTEDGLIRDRVYQQDSAPFDDLVLPACPSGRSSPSVDPKADQTCVPQQGYDAGMPDSPAAVLDWLRADVSSAESLQPDPQARSSASSDGSAVDALLFQRAGELLVGGRYLSSRQRSALFDALASLQGVTLRQQVRDLADREGVGIGMTEGTTLIFDATSYVFLGTANSALIRQAIVDSSGS
ncbi:CU044_5270 family protein [Micromonospora sp. LOL_021]|uniref:CU044_5270 family protein n=1 Tax=Micromonospora sp. LOL_021 TaxID=3345417 RepID=UPI003A87E3AA